jgi:hypothetical protein
MATCVKPSYSIIELLDVRGTLAIENEEKVIYVKCHLGQQLVSVARTLPWQCNHKGHPIVLRTRLVIAPTEITTFIISITTSSGIPGGGDFLEMKLQELTPAV